MKQTLLYVLLGFSPIVLWSHDFTIEQFQPLYALEGTWKSERTSGTLFEVWEKKNDSTLYGYSYQVSNNDTSYLENIQLTYREGLIVYQPTTMHQNNQQPVDFSLQNILASSYHFENKAHDFPQFIHYEVRHGDSLYASISGSTPGGSKTIHFNYAKVK